MTSASANRVVLYARASTAAQSLDGYSIRAQFTDLRAYASLYRMRVEREIRDDAASGKSLDRPGMVELRRAISQGEVDAVIVYRLDRLTRSVADLGTLLAELDAAGVALMTVDAAEKLDTSTASGRLVLNLLMSVSQWEREIIGERTRRGLQEARSSGKRLGKVPYGYRRDGDNFVRDEAQQRIVARMRRLRRQGESFACIADALNRDGIPTSGAGSWHAMTVSRIVNARPKRR